LPLPAALEGGEEQAVGRADHPKEVVSIGDLLMFHTIHGRLLLFVSNNKRRRRRIFLGSR
jgi:hypothetical protein